MEDAAASAAMLVHEIPQAWSAYVSVRSHQNRQLPAETAPAFGGGFGFDVMETFRRSCCRALRQLAIKNDDQRLEVPAKRIRGAARNGFTGK